MKILIELQNETKIFLILIAMMMYVIQTMKLVQRKKAVTAPTQKLMNKAKWPLKNKRKMGKRLAKEENEKQTLKIGILLNKICYEYVVRFLMKLSS